MALRSSRSQVGTRPLAPTAQSASKTPAGGNNLVTIHLDNLPPPDRIATGLTTYVVWFVAANASPVKAATLVYDADARVGDAAATTPLTTFEVRVTAERANTVAAPSESVAITLRVAGES